MGERPSPHDNAAPPVAWPHILPFAAYMAFIALEGIIQWLAGILPALRPLAAHDHVWLYPVKIGVVAVLLWWMRHHYAELYGPRPPVSALLQGLGAGVLVFAFWIRLDLPFARMDGGAEGYNPYLAGLSPAGTWALIGIRLLGAAVIVPVFEELFWRSFLMRYLISPRFRQVPLGSFRWPGFAVVCVLFGLEHNLWLAGILAGAVYGGLLCRSRNLPVVIIAHGTTNLLLGLWVLATGNWRFW